MEWLSHLWWLSHSVFTREWVIPELLLANATINLAALLEILDSSRKDRWEGVSDKLVTQGVNAGSRAYLLVAKKSKYSSLKINRHLNWPGLLQGRLRLRIRPVKWVLQTRVLNRRWNNFVPADQIAEKRHQIDQTAPRSHLRQDSMPENKASAVDALVQIRWL